MILAVTPERTHTHQVNNSSSVDDERPPASKHEPLYSESVAYSDVDRTKAWLANRMVRALGACTEGLRARTTVRCSPLNHSASSAGGAYTLWVETYSAIARDTSQQGDNRAAAAYELVGERQREFRTRVGSFWQTYEAYQEAQAVQNQTEMRGLARRINSQAGAVVESGERLQSAYGRLDAVSVHDPGNISRLSRTVGRINEQVNETAVIIYRGNTVETEIEVEAPSGSVSYLDPLAVSGRVRSTNGTTVRAGTVVIGTGERSVRTQLNSSGTFEITVRPKSVAVGERAFEVQYLPGPGSPYQPVNATLNRTVVQTDIEVKLARTTPRGRFGENVTVEGTVTAGETAVSSVPLIVETGGVQIDEVRTDENGTFLTRVPLPAAVPAGSQTLRARVPLEGRALVGANESAPIEVETTETDITASGSALPNGSVRITGQLSTNDGRPVPNQRVRLTLDGEDIVYTETGRNGQYNVTAFPSSTAGSAGGQVVNIVASYAGRDTNLQGSETVESVRFKAQGSPGRFAVLLNALGSGWSFATQFSGLVLVLLVLVVGPLRRAVMRLPRLARTSPSPLAVLQGRESSGGAAGQTAAGGEPVERFDESAVSSPRASEGGTRPRRLDLASERLEAGRADEAVLVAYGTVRRDLESLTSVTATTHREFTRFSEGSLEKEDVERLRRLTDVYERAAFAPTPVGADEAREMLTASADLLQSVLGDDGGLEAS
jgi:hypothetical protein